MEGAPAAQPLGGQPSPSQPVRDHAAPVGFDRCWPRAPGSPSLPRTSEPGELATGLISDGLMGRRGGMFFEGRVRQVGTSEGSAPKTEPSAPWPGSSCVR